MRAVELFSREQAPVESSTHLKSLHQIRNVNTRGSARLLLCEMLKLERPEGIESDRSESSPAMWPMPRGVIVAREKCCAVLYGSGPNWEVGCGVGCGVG